MTLRLNLGAGQSPIEGYDNSYDVAQGKKVFPLDLPDESVDEIRASHLLEHFSHRATKYVLAEWMRVLRPGGLIRIAVPDFGRITQMYQESTPAPYAGWMMGGHVDRHDEHKALFDRSLLSNLMREAGAVGIHLWPGEHDTSQLPISLNLGGWKPPQEWPKVIAALSAPRLGFMDTFGCITETLLPMRIPVYRRTGVFWGQCMTAAIEAAISDGAQWVLAIDYDTIFSLDTVTDLLATAIANPHVDALVPVQMSRLRSTVLMRPSGVPDSQQTWSMPLSEWQATLWPISTGHFGCTLLKAEALAKMARPWFIPTPDKDGRWADTHIDDDIHFWKQAEAAGLRAFLAPRIVVGHLENMIMWPDKNLKKIYQHPQHYWEGGRPAAVWV